MTWYAISKKIKFLKLRRLSKKILFVLLNPSSSTMVYQTFPRGDPNERKSFKEASWSQVRPCSTSVMFDRFVVCRAPKGPENIPEMIDRAKRVIEEAKTAGECASNSHLVGILNVANTTRYYKQNEMRRLPPLFTAILSAVRCQCLMNRGCIRMALCQRIYKLLKSLRLRPYLAPAVGFDLPCQLTRWPNKI